MEYDETELVYMDQYVFLAMIINEPVFFLHLSHFRRAGLLHVYTSFWIYLIQFVEFEQQIPT